MTPRSLSARSLGRGLSSPRPSSSDGRSLGCNVAGRGSRLPDLEGLRLRRLLYALQRIGLCGLEAEVKVEQLAPHPRPDVELVVQRQTGEFAQQVLGVVVEVHRVVQHGVGVGEYILGADAVRVYLVEVLAPLLTVVVVDTPDAPVGDVADALTLRGVAV